MKSRVLLFGIFDVEVTHLLVTKKQFVPCSILGMCSTSSGLTIYHARLQPGQQNGIGFDGWIN